MASNRWHEARAEALRDDAGNIIQWYGVNFEVGDLRHPEDNLLSSEWELRRLIDTIPAVAWAADAEGVLSYLNQRAADYVGLSRGNVLGAPFGSVHPDDVSDWQQSWTKSIETGQPFYLVYRLLRSDGQYRWNETRAAPLRDPMGKVVQWYGVNFDVHNMKTAEEALRSREKELRLLIDTVPSLVWCCDADGEVSYINQRLIEYAGITVEDLDFSERGRLREAIFSVVHPDDQDDVTRVLTQAFSTGVPLSGLRHRLRRADGVYRWVEARAEPLFDGGRIVQWYGVNVDIDDEKTHAGSPAGGAGQAGARVAGGEPGRAECLDRP